MRTLFALIVAGCLAFFAWQAFHFEAPLTYSGLRDAGRKALAGAFQETVKPEDLIAKYRNSKLRILLVPGHDNQNSGALYQGLREADLTIELARQLAEVLSADSHLEVVVARDLVSGEYQKNLAAFFNTNRESIVAFKDTKKALMAQLVASGSIADKTTNNHAFAKDEISYRLYGINKWVNENNIDLVIHVHFNDYPGHKADIPGAYKGMTVYVPEDQYPNGRASLLIGKSLFNSLSAVVATSTNPLEFGGVVPDQELIAIGSNASLNAASILIEYGYIYEPQFQAADVREKIFERLAQKTYEGLKGYLSK